MAMQLWNFMIWAYPHFAPTNLQILSGNAYSYTTLTYTDSVQAGYHASVQNETAKPHHRKPFFNVIARC